MLPGLRFLFVAVVLSFSMMIFGLGAAALLRSAQQQFANLPIRPQPETVFAQQIDANPTLAMLSVGPRIGEPKITDRPATSSADATAPQPSVSTDPVPVSVEPDKAVAEPATPVANAAAQPSAEKSETFEKPSDRSEKPTQAPVQVETSARIEPTAAPSTSTQPDKQAAATAATERTDTQAAAIPEPTSAPAIDAAATLAIEPGRAPADDSAKTASIETANPGGPAVVIDPPKASKPVAKPVKRTQARHVVRRRHVIRVRPAAPKPAIQAAQPVPGQIFITPSPNG